MTLPVNQQNCGNCYFVRTMPRVRSTSGPVGAQQSTTALACCLPAPGTMANPPSITNPWREVLAAYWCGQWADPVTGPADGAGASGKGSATLDFGAVPVSDASVDIRFQGTMPAGPYLQAWIQDDRQAGELLRLTAGNPIAGSGFTIYASSPEALVTGTVTARWNWSS